MKFYFLPVLVMCALNFDGFSQGEIPVDMYTGTPSIEIPVATVSSIDVSQRVTLSYNVNATQPSWFGMGWSLQAGGSISREVRGLPDDFGFDDGYSRKGWIFDYSTGTAASSVLFSPASDTSSATYGGEASDFSKFNAYNNLVDTEPDIFSYNVGGLSGKFVFDNSASFINNVSAKIRTIPYRDIKIEPIFFSGSDKAISAFKITTNDGYSYTFSARCTESRRLIKKVNWTDVYVLTNDYQQYANTVTYGIEWMLTEIKSPAGNTITYTYTNGDIETDVPNIPVDITIYKEDNPYEGLSTRDYITKTLFEIESTRTYKIPLTITASSGSFIEFTYNTTDKLLETVSLRDSRKGNNPATNLVKTFALGYINVRYMLYQVQSLTQEYTRYHLKTFSESSECDRLLPFTFDYQMSNSRDDLTGTWSVTINGYNLLQWQYYVRNRNEVNYPLMYIYTDKPVKNRYQYRNGYPGTAVVLDGDDREPDHVNGHLSAINYPTGGRTAFLFERHRYHDPLLNATEYSPGLRIREISYGDGTQRTPITKTFEYTDATGKSSGKFFRKKIHYLPSFQWKDLADNSNTLYGLIPAASRHKYLTIRTAFDLAPHDADNAVGYSRVKVSRTGSGYAVHEFLVPATYGETKSGDWETPETRIARQSSGIDLNNNSIFPTGGAWRFPNAPNPFYDYARGLPWRVSDYSESGKLVRRSRTTYQKLCKTDTSAFKVYGLKYDHMPLSEDNISNNRVYLFSKYFLITDTDFVPQIQSDTLYDVNDVTGTKYQVDRTEYTYGSTYPKLLTEVKRTAPDGNVYRTTFKYPKDYANQSTGEDAVQVLYKLANEFRHGAVIETVHRLKKGAAAEVVTAANVIKFSSFGYNDKVFPESQWSLAIDGPIPDFMASSVVNNSGYKFLIDSRYVQQSAVRSFSSNGLPIMTMSPISRDSAETAYGYSSTLPVVRSMKTTSGRSAFSDFDNITAFGFSYATPYLSEGRTGTYSYFPSVKLYKNFKRTRALNYVLSFWIRSIGNTNFTFAVKNQTQTVTYWSTTVNVPASGAEWTFFQQIVPLSLTVAPENVKDMRVELVANNLIPPGTLGFTPGLLPVIDDVFFFPEGTHVESYTYQIPYGLASIVTGEGTASFVEYDAWGRERLVRDRDRNIVSKTSYVIANNPSLLTADFHLSPAVVYVNTSAKLMGRTQLSCLGAVTYEWDWGSGYVVGSQIQSYTFTTTGTKTIKLRVSAAGYPAVEKTLVIDVLPIPVTANICAEGVKEFNATTAMVTIPFADCAQINTAPPSFRTTFQLINIGGCTDDCTYQWVRRDSESTPWLNVGVNSTQYTCEKIVTNTNSFQVGCMIKRGTEEPVLIGPMDISVIRP